MRIVGSEISEPGAGDVHTIDVWYSSRRSAWIVERLDAEGGHVGHAQVCADRNEAEECLGDWLRAHGETHLVGLHEADLRDAVSEQDVSEQDVSEQVVSGEADSRESGRRAA